MFISLGIWKKECIINYYKLQSKCFLDFFLVVSSHVKAVVGLFRFVLYSVYTSSKATQLASV